MTANPLVSTEYQYGFHDENKPVFKAKRGLNRTGRGRDFLYEERAGLDAQVPAALAGDVRAPAHAQLGQPGPGRARLRQHLLLPQAQRGPEPQLGRRAQRDQEHLRPPGHPRGREEVPGRRRRAVRVRGHLPQHPRGPGEAGRHLLRYRHGGARPPRAGAEVLRQDHPAERQQVRLAQQRGVERRLVHLRARERPRRAAAAGLLPHQRREHGPVRAHADHLRPRLLRPLRRRAAPRRPTPATRCTARWWRSSSRRARAAATPRSRTGARTSTTW